MWREDGRTFSRRTATCAERHHRCLPTHPSRSEGRTVHCRLTDLCSDACPMTVATYYYVLVVLYVWGSWPGYRSAACARARPCVSMWRAEISSRERGYYSTYSILFTATWHLADGRWRDTLSLLLSTSYSYTCTALGRHVRSDTV